jgi:broad specificity phosphatase PhoE
MLCIMRHGKTDWNELHKLQGHTDIPLNANGIAMAENAAKEYKNTSVPASPGKYLFRS